MNNWDRIDWSIRIPAAIFAGLILAAAFRIAWALESILKVMEAK